MLIWDIETEGLPDAADAFDPSSVKVGNLKDAAKIAAKVAEAREQFIEKAALSATTGRVLAIGYFDPAKEAVRVNGIGELETADKDEAEVIEDFWNTAEDCRDRSVPLVGLNIHEFDLPFLVRRSWILDLMIPDWVMSQDRYWDPIFVDLRKKWLCGVRATDVRSNFGELGAAFGTGGKTDGVTGADFSRLWWSDRTKAIEYLVNDVKQPATWAYRMGVC